MRHDMIRSGRKSRIALAVDDLKHGVHRTWNDSHFFNARLVSADGERLSRALESKIFSCLHQITNGSLLGMKSTLTVCP